MKGCVVNVWRHAVDHEWIGDETYSQPLYMEGGVVKLIPQTILSFSTSWHFRVQVATLQCLYMEDIIIIVKYQCEQFLFSVLSLHLLLDTLALPWTPGRGTIFLSIVIVRNPFFLVPNVIRHHEGRRRRSITIVARRRRRRRRWNRSIIFLVVILRHVRLEGRCRTVTRVSFFVRVVDRARRSCLLLLLLFYVFLMSMLSLNNTLGFDDFGNGKNGSLPHNIVAITFFWKYGRWAKEVGKCRWRHHDPQNCHGQECKLINHRKYGTRTRWTLRVVSFAIIASEHNEEQCVEYEWCNDKATTNPMNDEFASFVQQE